MFELTVILVICGFIFGVLFTAPREGYKTVNSQIIAGCFCAVCTAVFVWIIALVYAIVKQELGL